MERIFKRTNIVFSIALVITLIMSLFSDLYKTSETIDATGAEQVDRIKILIDPGHGGIDQGTSGGTGVTEAPLNLAISEKLMRFLEGSGFDVDMTRYEDEGLYSLKSKTIREKKNEDLKNRVDMINNSNADLVVSIHLNSFPQKQYYGAHVFYQKNSQLGKIAADTLQDSLKSILDPGNNRVPQVKKDIKIMDDTNIPVVLVECGFLSNDAEERKLVTDEYQEKIAWSIFTGLIKYFNEL
ncbi:N-acetylmuramoyl-L-alanine amidase [Sedimentibacter sp.]|uniref:N-acetylmuramoyl-L-alanine amidase n=1 Tax=Sedimentibacter sp. TaxID=1960295 RepID=UPI00289CF51B|nr:N-acetylmuramoyl-L-alanine amidase [Sedimentibacter sp.]